MGRHEEGKACCGPRVNGRFSPCGESAGVPVGVPVGVPHGDGEFDAPSARRLALASRYADRACGFLVNRPPGCILLIAPCSSIHTFGMRFPLDVAFVGRDGAVLRSERAVPPGRLMRCGPAAGVLERKSDDSREWYRVGEEVKLCIR